MPVYNSPAYSHVVIVAIIAAVRFRVHLHSLLINYRARQRHILL